MPKQPPSKDRRRSGAYGRIVDIVRRGMHPNDALSRIEAVIEETSGVLDFEKAWRQLEEVERVRLKGGGQPDAPASAPVDAPAAMPEDSPPAATEAPADPPPPENAPSVVTVPVEGRRRPVLVLRPKHLPVVGSEGVGGKEGGEV